MWTTENSKAACRQLGYAGVLQERKNKQKRADKYLIDMVNCNGTESSVCSCSSLSLGPETICDDSDYKNIELTCACKFWCSKYTLIHSTLLLSY